MTEQIDATIKCPKCDAEMRKLKIDEMTIDRCESCYGVWLDKGERIKITAHKNIADVVDIGSADVGKEHDKIQDINCPRCGVKMHHRHHPDQKHIGFEECGECGGSFFDAGELKDLSRFSLSDVINIFIRRR